MQLASVNNKLFCEVTDWLQMKMQTSPWRTTEPPFTKKNTVGCKYLYLTEILASGVNALIYEVLYVSLVMFDLLVCNAACLISSRCKTFYTVFHV